MLAKDLKALLTTDDIIKILTSMGCEYVKQHGNYITSTRANGSDNKTGVIVYLNGEFNALMPTDFSFEKEAYKDIFTVVQKILNLSFPQAMKYICEVLELDYYSEKIQNKPQILSWLDKIESSKIKMKQPSIILSDKVLNSYFPYLHKKWHDEGIDILTAKAFEISYDIETNAIIIPIKDETGSLLGVQARNLNDNTQSKYYYPYPLQKGTVLYGFYQNYQSIKEKKQVIIFEGAKSVLQAHSLGITNTVALLGKTISPYQIDILNRMGCEIVLALDNDVTDEEIYFIAEEINRYVVFNDISVLKDELQLFLKDKDSPTDSKEFLQNYEAFKYTLIEKS